MIMDSNIEVKVMSHTALYTLLLSFFILVENVFIITDKNRLIIGEDNPLIIEDGVKIELIIQL